MMRYNLCSSGLLHRVGWFDMDVSGQCIGPIFESQGVQEVRPLTYILGQHIGHIFRVKMSKKKGFFLDLSIDYVQEWSVLFMFLTLNKETHSPRMLVANLPMACNNIEYSRFRSTHNKELLWNLFKPFFFTISIICNNCNSQTDSLNYKWLPAGFDTPGTDQECMYHLYLLFMHIGSFTQFVYLCWRNSRAKSWVIDTWCTAGVSPYLNLSPETHCIDLK